MNRILRHEGHRVRVFYSTLRGRLRVAIEATGSIKWFLQLTEELGIDRQVGHPATIRAAEPRRQKDDQRDAELLLKNAGMVAFEIFLITTCAGDDCIGFVVNQGVEYLGRLRGSLGGPTPKRPSGLYLLGGGEGQYDANERGWGAASRGIL